MVRARIFEQSKGKYEVRVFKNGLLVRRVFAMGPVSKSKAKKFAKKIREGKTESIF